MQCALSFALFFTHLALQIDRIAKRSICIAQTGTKPLHKHTANETLHLHLWVATAGDACPSIVFVIWQRPHQPPSPPPLVPFSFGFLLTEIGNFTLDDGLQIGQQTDERQTKTRAASAGLGLFEGISRSANCTKENQIPDASDDRERATEGVGAGAELKESSPDILWFSFVETFSQRPWQSNNIQTDNLYTWVGKGESQLGERGRQVRLLLDSIWSMCFCYSCWNCRKTVRFMAHSVSREKPPKQSNCWRYDERLWIPFNTRWEGIPPLPSFISFMLAHAQSIADLWAT